MVESAICRIYIACNAILDMPEKPEMSLPVPQQHGNSKLP